MNDYPRYSSSMQFVTLAELEALLAERELRKPHSNRSHADARRRGEIAILRQLITKAKER